MDRGSDMLGEGVGSILGRDRGRSLGPEPGGSAIGGGSGSGGESVAVAVAVHSQDFLSSALGTKVNKARPVPERIGLIDRVTHLILASIVTSF